MTHPRYARQVILPEVGEDGQQRLAATRVLCIGAGGLGSPALLYLAAAGIGTLGIIDPDRVDLSNLQRQILFTHQDTGHLKVERAKERLHLLNPGIQIDVFAERLGPDNAPRLFAQYDIVIDGTDNFSTKYLINDVAVALGKPVVYGSVLGFGGQLSVFWARHGPCLRCLFPQPPQRHVPNCAEAGVIGAAVGLMGTMQAMETLKLALGLDHCRAHGLSPLIGKLLTLDARDMSQRTLRLEKSISCPACGDAARPMAMAASAIAPVHSLSGPELAALDTPIFIDVREPHEWAATGTLPDAVLMPLGQVMTLTEFPVDWTGHRPLVVYCAHGIRSEHGARHLQSLARTAPGSADIHHLDGGVAAWPELLRPFQR